MSFSRSEVLRMFPWLQQRNLDMVIGDDLDALLSALVLHHTLGWNVVGLYQEYTTVWHQCRASALRDAVWVDLDISQPDIRSIGHHILYDGPGRDESAHALNVNPNRLRGVTGISGQCTTKGATCSCGSTTFRHKYPLGTVHFLLWLFDLQTPEVDWLDALLWHADSAWINGQSHKYAPNVRDWATNHVPIHSLMRGLNQINDVAFEDIVSGKVIPFLKRFGFLHGRSQTSSRHRGITNWQCQFQSLATSPPDIADFWNTVGRELQLSPPRIAQGSWNQITGRRRSGSLGPAVAGGAGLAEFVRTNDVFSYVIPNSGRINWTSGIRVPR